MSIPGNMGLMSMIIRGMKLRFIRMLIEIMKHPIQQDLQLEKTG